jgi:drug/metabolite transporter (DMT)-like permease
MHVPEESLPEAERNESLRLVGEVQPLQFGEDGYQYLITLTGVISGVLLLGEELGKEQSIGTAIIFCGVYLGRRQ